MRHIAGLEDSYPLRVNESISSLVVALALYASTNIDNLFVLSLLFADPHLHPRLVVVGSFVALAVVGAISVIIGLGALRLPQGYASILGILPLALGVQRLTALWADRSTRTATPEGPEPRGVLADQSRLEQSTHSQVLAVAGVTLASSADNLAAYVTLFAHSPARIPLYLLAFAVLTGVWCIAGCWLARNPVVQDSLRHVGRLIFPMVMMVLAAWILWGLKALIA